MKKGIVIQAAALTLLMAVGSASAEEPISTMPIDAGIVIDVSNGGEAPAPEAKADVNALVTQQAEDEAAANDGTVLPIDQGNVNTQEPDTGVVVETAPQEDTVVLTEVEPVVEPLPQTGIADNSIALATIAGLLAVFGITFSRRSRTN